MLMPKRTKYRKTQRGKIKGTVKCSLPQGRGPAARNQHRKALPRVRPAAATSKATRGNRVSFGDYGLQALEWCWLSARTIEAGRVAASRASGEGKIWIRVFPHKPVTAKPLEVRMGNGKGDVDRWVAVVKPGTVLYEIGGIEEAQARKALNRVSHKMPVKCRMITRKPI